MNDKDLKNASPDQLCLLTQQLKDELDHLLAGGGTVTQEVLDRHQAVNTAICARFEALFEEQAREQAKEK